MQLPYKKKSIPYSINLMDITSSVFPETTKQILERKTKKKEE